MFTTLAGFTLTAGLIWTYCKVMNDRLARSHAKWMAEQRANAVK